MVHLHTHSSFSFLDGVSPIEHLVERAAEMGMPALALTDHDNLAAAVRFTQQARKSGIKPILGAEVTTEGNHHLTLLCRNRAGYASLCRLLTQAHLNNERLKPQATWEMLEANAEGLVCLSGCPRGAVSFHLARGRYQEAEEAARRLIGIFGKESFLLESQRLLLPGERALGAALLELAERSGVRVVATNNVHYLHKEQFRAQDVLTCVHNLVRIDQPHPERKINAECYLKSPEEMRLLFADCPQAVLQSEQLAQECDAYELSGREYLPRFPVPEGETAQGMLNRLVYQGAKMRYGRITDKVRQRLEYELSIIEQLGFADYFLVVWDAVQFARARGIRFGGRGSAADSAVAYCLFITAVDSIARNLQFERFINLARAHSLPDIDVDFDARYRDDVTAHVTQKYGQENVAGLCTFNRFRARSALRDLGKALNFPETEIDRLAKLMPWIEADEIEQAMKRVPELRDSGIPADRYRLLFELCAQVADQPRHLGTHLGGVIISGKPLDTLSPVQMAAKGIRILQFDKDDVEDLSLLKLDLLCLRMLGAVEDTVRPLQLDLDTVPLNNGATYALLGTGETAGAFQLESPAQRALQQRLKADNPEDVVASVALIRPGPLQGNMVEPFLARRKGRAPVTYIHPALEKILKKTYGVVLFQEQVIEIAVEIAGFDPGEADELRRAMTHHRSKKEMEDIGRHFIRKAMERGVSHQVAETVFSYVEGYAGYGFCEAHAAAFGDTAYRTAYLLQHCPAHFYAGILNNQPMGFYPPHTIVTEARRRGIRILPLDINAGDTNFLAGEDAIRVGCKDVKNLGEKDIESLLAARARRPFDSLPDFLQRTAVSVDAAESLILAGAFDSLHPNRRSLLWQLRLTTREAGLLSAVRRTMSCTPPDLPDFSEMEKTCHEWEIVGFGMKHHLMDFARETLEKEGIRTAAEAKAAKDGTVLKAAGLLIRPHRPPTRSGRTVVFFSLEDETGLLDVTCFENIYHKFGHLIFTQNALVVEGRLQTERGLALIACKIAPLPRQTASQEPEEPPQAVPEGAQQTPREESGQNA
jgi:error-prone DNA polymerase